MGDKKNEIILDLKYSLKKQKETIKDLYETIEQQKKTIKSLKKDIISLNDSTLTVNKEKKMSKYNSDKYIEKDYKKKSSFKFYLIFILVLLFIGAILGIYSYIWFKRVFNFKENI